MDKKKKIQQIAVCFCLAACMAAAQKPSFGDYNCRTGIVYKTVNGEALDLALFFPTVKRYEKMPVMIYTHGGGWSRLDKTVIFWPNFRETLDIILQNGIACAAIEYRLARPGISTAYDCVVDCKDSARFLMKHADEYGLDPERIGVWGGSAGGHLGLMTVLAPDEKFPGDPALKGAVPKFRCAVAYFPATTFLVPDVLANSIFERPGLFPLLLGGPLEERRELAELLSPAKHLSLSNPPVLLLHGDQDQVLPYINSTFMMEVAKERGADVELLTVTNGLHGFAGENIRPSRSEINRLAAEYIMQKLLKSEE